MDELIQHLKELGFNTYESKVYLSLVKNHPATGYEVSKDSGVPQARAYDTLKTLENRGIVIAQQGRPVTYTPVSPQQLLDNWEKSFQHSVSYLRETLPHLNKDTVEPIHNLQGRQACLEHLEEKINSARHSIFVEMWNNDAVRLAPALKAAADRGLGVYIVGYDGLEFDWCHVYPHPTNDDLKERYSEKWMMMSVDGEEGLIATFPDSAEKTPQLISTRNPGIVFVIQELVTHNVFLIELEDRLSEEFESKFGASFISLRSALLDSHDNHQFMSAIHDHSPGQG